MRDLNERGGIIVIAPFWNRNDHVGQYRVERLIRWLTGENYSVTIIWSGWKDNFIKKDKLIELEIRDPLRRFTRSKNNRSYIGKKENQTKSGIGLRSLVQKVIFYFDRDLIWSIWLTKKKIIKNVCNNSLVVISSSPPESTHLASYILAKKFGMKLLVDMRDGWLDEPMRKFGKRWSLKKVIEQRWELKVIHRASHVFVTSNNWKKLLEDRISSAASKTTVLTNAYPVNFTAPKYQQHKEKLSSILLMHTGRFLGTRSTNRMSILLQALHKVLSTEKEFETKIVLIGNLQHDDLGELEYWNKQFNVTRSEVINKDRIPRQEMLNELIKANGLLLLAATKAFFPSKTFEYIKSAKPILAVTLKNSTIWQIGQNLPQMFLYDYSDKEKDYSPILKFLDACRTGKYEYEIPEEYSEDHLSKKFIAAIKKVNFFQESNK